MKIENLLFMFAGIDSQVIPKGDEPNDLTANGLKRTVNISHSEEQLYVHVVLPLGETYILKFKSEGLNWVYEDFIFN